MFPLLIECQVELISVKLTSKKKKEQALNYHKCVLRFSSCKDLYESFVILMSILLRCASLLGPGSFMVWETWSFHMPLVDLTFLEWWKCRIPLPVLPQLPRPPGIINLLTHLLSAQTDSGGIPAFSWRYRALFTYPWLESVCTHLGSAGCSTERYQDHPVKEGWAGRWCKILSRSCFWANKPVTASLRMLPRFTCYM